MPKDYKKEYSLLLKYMKRIQGLDYSFSRIHEASDVSEEALSQLKALQKKARVSKKIRR